MAIAEIQELMMVHTQLITPQRNAPIMGIVQDTLASIRIFSQRDTFLTRSDVMQMMLTLIEKDLLTAEQQRLPIPAICKSPDGPLWTGKQIVALLWPKDLQLDTYSKFAEKDADDDEEDTTNDKKNAPTAEEKKKKEEKAKRRAINFVLDPADTHVRIVNGELLSGTLDKKTCGSMPGSLVQIVNNDYGGKKALEMLNGWMRMLHMWMTHRGFSVGLGDMTPSDQVRAEVKKMIADARSQVSVLAEKFKRNELETLRGQTQLEAFEMAVNNELNKTRDKCGQTAHASFPNSNPLKVMEQAGSKGNKTNIAQMAGAVGQQNLTGKRIPLQFERNTRSFPHCVAGDLNDIEGRGFVSHSYFDGLTPLEFFSHAIGGREGVTDTAVKTSETGYLQRRLVKAMEDLHVASDRTVRDSTGGIVQFVYGEDDKDGVGIESQKIELLAMSDLQLLETFCIDSDADVSALGSIFTDADVADLENLYEAFEKSKMNDLKVTETEQKLVWKEVDRMYRLRNALREYIFRNRSDEHYWPLPCNVRRTIGRAKSRFASNDDKMSVEEILEALQRFQEQIWQNSDPLVALNNHVAEQRQVDTTFLFLVQVLSYLSPKRTLCEWQLGRNMFEWILQTLVNAFQKSSINAGEAVGALAGQSIGEPATQVCISLSLFLRGQWR